MRLIQTVNMPKYRNIFFVESPTLKQENIANYKVENMPKDRDFQKKYMLL